MPRRPPSPYHDPLTSLHIRIPTSLALQVRRALFNPHKGTIRYGSQSALVERLLRNWLNPQAKEPHTND